MNENQSQTGTGRASAAPISDHPGMSANTTGDPAGPAYVVACFLGAFARHDMQEAARYVSEDVVFESPRVKVAGAADYLAAIGEFANIVDKIEIDLLLTDQEHAIALYDMHTASFGVIRAADTYHVTGGKITANRLLFDTGAFTSPRTAPRP
jgi:limonene-1,2-epoxide hydrolase